MNSGELYYVARRLRAVAEQALGAAPGAADAVPYQHQLVLGFVLDSPGCTVGDIARGLSLAQSAVSTAVATLRDQGLLATAIDPDDRRRTCVSPSPRLARWASSHLSSDASDALAPVLDGLGARQKADVLRGLSLLLAAFRGQDDTGPSPVPSRRRTT